MTGKSPQPSDFFISVIFLSQNLVTVIFFKVFHFLTIELQTRLKFLLLQTKYEHCLN